MVYPLSLPLHPIGLSSTYTGHSQPVAVKIQEHLFSHHGETVFIEDISGKKLLKVDGKAFSLHKKKGLKDPTTDAVVFTIKKKLGIHTTFEFQNAEGLGIATFKAKGKIGKDTHMELTFKNKAHDGKEVTFEVRGDWFGRKLQFQWGDKSVAYVTKNMFLGTERGGDAESYLLHITPYVDISLVIAACVALDEKDNEEHDSGHRRVVHGGGPKIAMVR